MSVVQQSETAGVVLLGIVNAFQKIEVISTDDAVRFTRNIAPDRWYPLTRFFALMDALTAGGRDIAPILFRAGNEFIKMWYAEGPGHTFIRSGVDFLRFQAGSSGYSSVVRGPREEVGYVELAELDEPAGLARITSVTPFPCEFDRGVFFGGVAAPGDVSWVEASSSRIRPHGKLTEHEITIRFRARDEERAGRLDQLLKQRSEMLDGPAVPDDLASELYWRFQELQVRYEMDVSFLSSVSKILSQEAQRRSEALLASVLNSMDDLVFLLDADGRFMGSCQDARLFAPPEEWVGKVYKDVMPPSIVDKYRPALRRVREPGQKENVDYALPFGDGRRWFSASISPRMTKDGDLDGHTVVVRNITERKLMEEEQQRARQAAEAASRAKTALLANTSHEVRTPMNAIIGLTELALGDDCSPKVRDYLSKILASSRSLLGILNDLIDFSKMESEKVILEPTCLDLRMLLQEIACGFDSAVLRRGIKLVVSTDDRIPRFVMADPLRLRQVLTNLVNNAIKFTSAGSVAVTARLIGATADRVTLELAVKDSGIGIAPELIPSLFEPFRQADGSTTRRYGGSGLGLSICKRLVELMGSEIVVESVPGEGSRFAFILALARPPDDASIDCTAGRSAKLDEEDLQRLRGARVLVVEDNEINQQVAAELLQSVGVTCEIAENGREALRALAEGAFDAVLMDIQMPEIDGFEATRRIRDQPQFVDLPIIAMTAHAMKGDREKSLACGMNAHVTKPIDSRELFAALAACIDTTDLNARVSEEQPPAAPVQQQASVQPSLPERLSGIDLPTALERVAGNRAALRAILVSFARNFSDASVAISEAWERGDSEEARRLVHQVKGVSGNISANTLHQEAIALQVAIEQNDQDRFDTCLWRFARRLEEVVIACATLDMPEAPGQQEASSEAAAAIEIEQLLPLLQELAGMLRENRASAVSFFQSMRSKLLREPSIADLVATLGEQIERLDFDAARQTLRKVGVALGSTGEAL